MDYNAQRNDKDQFFKHHDQSPLTADQRENFVGLNYFDSQANLRMELEIEAFETPEPVEIQTSTGEPRTYKRFGKVHFEIDGEKVELTLFETPHGFFLPFVDSQAGEITYGAGRYLDPHVLPNGKVEVDFNLAYNPYCAYNELYSCPIPPAENRLKIAIKAGEKNFK